MTDFQVGDFQVSDYQVPEYTVADYAGPDLNALYVREDVQDPGQSTLPHQADGPETSWPGEPARDGLQRVEGQVAPVQGHGVQGEWGPGQPGSSAPQPQFTGLPSATVAPRLPPNKPGVPQPAHGGPAQVVPPRPVGPPIADGSSMPSGAARRIVVGKPAAFVEPKPPPTDPYRPDTIFDGWSTPRLTVRLASVRGDAHRSDGNPRQDDVVVAWHEPTGAVVFAVADGVSAAPLSHVGAALACRTAVNDLLVQLGEGRQAPDWSRLLQAAAYQLFMRAARGREPDERDKEEAVRTLSTTLVAGMALPTADGALQVTLVRAGDSSAWCLHGGAYAQLLYDEGADRGDISSTAVVALPRISARSWPMSYTLPSNAVLLVGTDGFGVPLGDGTGRVGELFAKGLAVPPTEPAVVAHLLNFSRETFDDDRTLLAIWARHPSAGGILPSGGTL
ncbi:protein phosphatase 2C domain-containing protein [Streptomyces sp. NPDC047990]|uniref:protein phosphatase 2C domain-containing protein n=1 Tax=Streptomyces sp. NPDC047990 TaxID=3365496 RepID=UPI003714D6ED